MERWKRAAPYQYGGALLQVLRCEFVAAEAFTTQQIYVLFAEETWLNVRAEVGLSTLPMVLDVLSSQPCTRLGRVELREEVSAER